MTIVSNLINNALTNTTTNTTNEAQTMNTIKTTEINTNALSSTVAAHLFHQVNNARVSVLLACCVVDAASLVGDLDMPEAFVELVIQSLDTAKLETTVSGEGQIAKQVHDMAIPTEMVLPALVEAGLANEDGTMGDRMIEMMEQRTEAYAPTQVGHEWKRRFPMYSPEKGQCGDLAIEAIHALESTQYTIDASMLIIANQVQALSGGAEKDDEAYVLAGCNSMDAENAYTSEFKADRRIRLYQAACHGPNGQASDRSRALMDLAKVTTDYDVDAVKEAIKAEVMDMVSIPANKVGKLMTRAITNPVEFIMTELALPKNERSASKPWSFTKAAIIWSELMKGNKPYIGMAVGLDAKCSGPQLGALMVGDAEIAAACGMTLTKLEDAYQRCIAELEAAGFVGFTRGGIKKSFMGVFYGQGWAAFTDVAQLTKDEQFEVVSVLYPDGVVSDDVAKRFHKAVTKSFGKKMVALRERIKEFNGNITGRTGHMMPDNSKVQMNYKVKMNILDEAIEHDTTCPDVTVTTGEFTYKFIKLALNTTIVHTSDFVRTAFVNMIQATDALIARLIIVHLHRLGAQHIIAVHDCFRVNVTEMHLLKQAIINAYQDLFGSDFNVATKDLPLGTDILGLFFKGMQAAVTTDAKVIPMPQFIKIGNNTIRKMRAIRGTKVSELIDALGTSYYFAK